MPVASWFDDMTDSELRDLIPFFEKLSKVENIYSVLCNSNHPLNQIPSANAIKSSNSSNSNNATSTNNTTATGVKLGAS